MDRGWTDSQNDCNEWQPNERDNQINSPMRNLIKLIAKDPKGGSGRNYKLIWIFFIVEIIMARVEWEIYLSAFEYWLWSGNEIIV